MRCWTPEPDDPHLLDWWLPLVRVARRALDEEVPWLIVLDQWALAFRVERRGRPDVWVYVHARSRRELCVDHTGQPYRFIANSRGPSPGRFKEIETRSAVWRAGLPDVDEAVWFEPRARSFHPPDWHEPLADDDEQSEGRPGLHLVR